MIGTGGTRFPVPPLLYPIPPCGTTDSRWGLCLYHRVCFLSGNTKNNFSPVVQKRTGSEGGRKSLRDVSSRQVRGVQRSELEQFV